MKKVNSDELRQLIKAAKKTGDWIPVEQADVSEITDMSNMFNSAVGINNLDLSGWDTSNVIDMSYMFFNSDFDNSSILHWNVCRVISMTHMFSDSIFNRHLNWDTTCLRDTTSMFSYGLFNSFLYLNTSSVEDMSCMFYGSKFNQPLLLNTSNVKSMEGMFCESAYNHPLDSFDTSKVKNMRWMFMESCYSHSLEHFNTNSLEYAEDMFHLSDFVGDISMWNLSKIKAKSSGNIDTGYSHLKAYIKKYQTYYKPALDIIRTREINAHVNVPEIIDFLGAENEENSRVSSDMAKQVMHIYLCHQNNCQEQKDTVMIASRTRRF